MTGVTPYFSDAEAYDYFREAMPSAVWSSLAQSDRKIVMNRASVRFDSLPWTDDFATREQRLQSQTVIGAFYDLVRYYASTGDSATLPVTDEESLRRIPVAFRDLPPSVLSRLVTVFPQLSSYNRARLKASPMNGGGAPPSTPFSSRGMDTITGGAPPATVTFTGMTDVNVESGPAGRPARVSAVVATGVMPEGGRRLIQCVTEIHQVSGLNAGLGFALRRRRGENVVELRDVETQSLSGSRATHEFIAFDESKPGDMLSLVCVRVDPFGEPATVVSARIPARTSFIRAVSF